MNQNIILTSEWRSNNNIHVKSSNLDIPSFNSTNEILNFLNEEKNYFFSGIVELKESIVFFVDFIRSSPLYYSFINGEIVITDDPIFIKKKLSDPALDENSIKNFMFTGYTLENSTIWDSVFSLCAGEVATYNKKDHTITINNYINYKLNQKPTEEFDLSLALNELDNIVNANMVELIKKANGRQIVVPLSGGLDSRLIVTKLKEHGYSNVLCFTYGKKNNKESIISKTVAKKMDFRWEFVEYTEDMWYELFHSEKLEKAFSFLSGSISVPHIQDYLAIENLLQKKIIDENAIIVPGHIASFQIPFKWYADLKNTKNKSEKIAEIIIEKNFSLKKITTIEKENVKKFLIRKLRNEKFIKSEDYISYYHEWELKERQSKLIVNSLKVYEYHNLEWDMPLFKKNLLTFFSFLPLEERLDKKLYRKYVVDYYATFTNTSIESASKTDKNKWLISIKRKVKTIGIFKGLYFYMKKKKMYHSHHLNWFYIFTYKEFLDRFSGHEHFNFFLAEKFISTIKERKGGISN